MASRRMFAQTIIDSDAFLDMPLSTQALYFHLSMRADDEGFVNNAKKIMRMIGSAQNEIQLLLSKRFLLTFGSGVVVIKHWKIHNYIRQDRIVQTAHQAERKALEIKDNGAYTEACQLNDGLVPDESPHRLGEVSIGKDRLGKDNSSDKKAVATTPQASFIEELKTAYEVKTNMQMKVDKKDYILIAKLIKDYGIEAVKEKAQVMAIYCEKENLGWWCKGWGDFTIGNLSCRWNELVPKLTEKEKAIKEVMDHEEQCSELGLRKNKQIT